MADRNDLGHQMEGSSPKIESPKVDGARSSNGDPPSSATFKSPKYSRFKPSTAVNNSRPANAPTPPPPPLGPSKKRYYDKVKPINQLVSPEKSFSKASSEKTAELTHKSSFSSTNQWRKASPTKSPYKQSLVSKASASGAPTAAASSSSSPSIKKASPAKSPSKGISAIIKARSKASPSKQSASNKASVPTASSSPSSKAHPPKMPTSKAFYMYRDKKSSSESPPVVASPVRRLKLAGDHPTPPDASHKVIESSKVQTKLIWPAKGFWTTAKSSSTTQATIKPSLPSAASCDPTCSMLEFSAMSQEKLQHAMDISRHAVRPPGNCLVELEATVRKLTIRDGSDLSMPADTLHSLRSRLHELTIALTTVDDFGNNYPLFNWEEVVTSALFALHIPRFLDNRAIANDSNLLTVLKDLLNVYRKGCQSTISPDLAESLRVQLTVCKSTANRFSNNNNAAVEIDASELASNFEQLIDSIVTVIAAAAENASCNADVHEDDFRKMPIYPTANDLVADRPSSVRANIVQGPYESVDDYLDLQFRLLREDVVLPLREAIPTNPNYGINGHKSIVYSNVLVIHPDLTQEGVTFELHCNQFNRARHGNEDKKLLDGSLLCLSNDGFQKVFCMAVIERTPQEARRNGIIKVIFLEEYKELFQQRFGERFDLVESPTYFLPYRHVLAGLQSLDDRSFPFKRYLIGGNINEVRPPRYLTQDTKYKLSGKYDVRVLDDSSWPSPSELGLDEAQLEALKSALTKELAVIQGPPGTGKTFLGLKIVQTLLDNDRCSKDDYVWSDGSPILIACYTNHALDQFLEGILKFCPTGVVRIGGRSKCSALQAHNLSVKRRGPRSKETTVLVERRNELYDIMHQIREDVQKFKVIYTRSHSAVFFKQILQPFMLPGHYEQFATFEQDPSNEFPDIHCWLQLVDFDGLDDLQLGWNEADNERSRFPFRQDVIFDELRSHDSMNVFEMITVDNIWNLRVEDRWRLYRHWIENLRKFYTEQIWGALSQMTIVYQKVLRIRRQITASFLCDAKVIGMTTTGSAINFLTLTELIAPKVVIIEEAAEILEAHTLLTMTKHCEHVIMIGDHQQLRPKVSSHELEMNLKLDVSLFERLINNGIPYDTLSLQHRMRPIISAMLTPHIYEVLRNHESVERYEDIRGVASSLFFVDHRHTEDSSRGGSSTSRSNVHEARFIVALCQYLVKQDYQPERITVLTTYLSQHAVLQSALTSCGLSKVACTSVDNFQGEENDIILLSLVRSNHRGSIGFVRMSNRACVALSRARMGFYCIGNFQLLSSKSDLWRKIVGYLQSVDCIGPSLKLVCSNHPATITEVKTFADFDRVPNGGCQVHCEATLPNCGHRCTAICHPYDRDHLKYECREPCDRKCAKDLHDCVKRCWMKCSPCLEEVPQVYPDCGHRTVLKCHQQLERVPCAVPITKSHPTCGHDNVVECSQDTFDCKADCSKTLACGHPCRMKCAFDCTTYDKCDFACDHILPCQHLCIGRCGQHCFCNKPCMKTLACGHACVSICGQPCFCKQPCSETLSCGHQCGGMCGQACPPCQQACEKILDCEHQCRMRCSQPCNNDDCQIPVSVTKSPCGHEVTVACAKSGSLVDLLRACKTPCLQELPCGHLCDGSCVDCAQGRNHVQCRVRVERVLVCGHLFVGPCFLETSKTNCLARCDYICGHGDRCQQPCSWQCKKCNRRCVWRCPHFICTRKCYEMCDRPPCEADCPLRLPCGHPCRGLCGEACPPLCKVCDAQPEVFFGTEDDVDARFVLLPDCGHFFEVKSLDKWMGLGGDDEAAKDDVFAADLDQVFGAKRCPKCDVLVCRASRYNGVIKTSLHEHCFVKKIVIENRNYVMERFTEMLDLWKSFGLLEDNPRVTHPWFRRKDDQRKQPEKVPVNQQLRRLLFKIKNLVAADMIKFPASIRSSVDEKIDMLFDWLPARLPTALKTANYYREFLRIWYLMTIVKSVGSHLLPTAAMSHYRRCFELLTSVHQFTLTTEGQVRLLLVGINGIKFPKPMKRSVGWTGNWRRCANCDHVYFLTGFVDVVQDVGCSMCNFKTDQAVQLTFGRMSVSDFT